MRYNIFLRILVIMLLLPFAGRAQKNVNPHFEAHRLDFRDLGYPAATLIPADDSPIAALLAHSNGKVYGATSGKQSFLFVFDPLTNKVYPLGKIPESIGVHNGLVEGKKGLIYIGTGMNELELINLSKDVPYGRRTIENHLWNEIKNKYKGFEGGKIFVYDPTVGDKEVYLPDDFAKVRDLGVPITGNSVYAMSMNGEKDRIYGISYPDAHFFEFDMKTGKMIDHGAWLTTKSYAGPERSWRSVPRALVCLSNGRVLSSGDHGLIHYFDPGDKKIHKTQIRIPGEYWITQKYEAYPVAEQLLLQPDGSVLGGTSDGFVFQIDSMANHLKVIGKPMVERRIRAMTLGDDQQLYMICGEKTNVCRMFSYDLSDTDKGFLDYGVLGVDRSPYYAKIGYQFDAMCTAADGTIFIGESDRRAKLFFYVPGGNIVPGVLNPTNPR
ncbi:MAG: hypothetical protein AAFX53_13025 [Bacteroidota bacterium]